MFSDIVRLDKDSPRVQVDQTEESPAGAHGRSLQPRPRVQVEDVAAGEGVTSAPLPRMGGSPAARHQIGEAGLYTGDDLTGVMHPRLWQLRQPLPSS